MSEEQNTTEHTHEHSEHHEHHEHKEGKSKVGLWKILTVVIAVLLVISIYTQGFYGFNFGAKELSQEEASAKALKFINTNLLQGQAVAELKEIKEEGGLYNMKLNVEGREIDSYITKNAELFFPQAIKLDGTAAATTPAAEPVPEVPKSDKPKVELFVMSHCPYGTQAEKGILPVANLLKDKIDFDLKFVYYAMHGETEVKEEMNQVCIKNEQSGLFRTYLTCFLDAGDGEKCLVNAKVDKTKLASCVKKLDADYKITEKLADQKTWLSGRFPLFDVYKADNEKYQVGGSPVLVVNGAEANSGRSPSAYLATVCAAFNKAPEECQEKLSAETYAAGFGYATGPAGAGAGCGN